MPTRAPQVAPEPPRAEAEFETEQKTGHSTLARLITFAWLRSPAKRSQRGASQRNWTRLPAFLSSIVLHCAIFICLALWSITQQLGGARVFDFEATSTDRLKLEQPVEMKLATGDKPPPPQQVPQEAIDQPKFSSMATSKAVSELLTVRGPAQAEIENAGEFDRLLNAASLSMNSTFASTGVDGRKLKERRKVALERGGTLESEKAVEAGLDWIAEHQQPNGSWSLIHSNGVCKGRCKNDGAKGRFDTAATGLSLLSFLGAGYTHKDGKHRTTVRKGVYFLIQVMEETPQGGSFLYQSDRGMYNHGIAAFALCEAYQLTNDKDLREPAQKAIDFIVSAQNYRGGWGYLPKQPGDLTLSGWQIMALKSAFAAGLEIPDHTILKIDGFLDTQQSLGGTFFGYGKPGKSPTCTSIGLLVRLFRGMTYTDPRVLDGAAYLRGLGPSNTDAYYNYYVTLFLFHIGGGLWEHWNPVIRNHLVESQSNRGHEAGSWYFDNPYGREGGRLYTTAMCVMTLEVYYRFSPLYQQTDDRFDL